MIGHGFFEHIQLEWFVGLLGEQGLLP